MKTLTIAVFAASLLAGTAVGVKFKAADNYSMTAAAGATVRVDLGERKTSSRTPIISWTTPPDSISFAWPDGVNNKGCLVKKDDGLYVTRGFTIIVL